MFSSPNQVLGAGMHLDAIDFHVVRDTLLLQENLQMATYALVCGLNQRYRSIASLSISVTEDCSLVTTDETFSGTRLSMDAFYEGETKSHQYMIRRGGRVDPVKAGLRTLDCNLGLDELQDRMSAIIIVGAFLDL